MSNFNVHIAEGCKPIKMWTKGVPLDEKVFGQLERVAALPFVHSHVAAMPDVHWGIGATVGSVIPTRHVIIPAAVGVDIGCGMMAYETTLTANDLPDSLSELRDAIERAVPHGFVTVPGRALKGGWEVAPNSAVSRYRSLADQYDKLIEKHPGAAHKSPLSQMGSLGTGNHFIELCLDENDIVWVMLHSGSRGPGNCIGRYFIEKAKEEMRRYYINLPDKDLAYLTEGSELFRDYMDAVGWAQDYAMENRKQMMLAVLGTMHELLPSFSLGKMAVNCHHNYISREKHFGEEVYVTRKGAVRAQKDDLGIIPGSMGTGSFIVRGKGNRDSFCSCSHGAGRAMSRGDAKRLISLEEHVEAMKGIEARLDIEVLDESPRAYKDIGAVMAAQDDLVEIVARLRQVLNVKG